MSTVTFDRATRIYPGTPRPAVDALDLEEVDFALRDALADTLATLSLRAYQKGLELAYHVAPDVPDDLTGDPYRLRQVLTNLLDNAVKYSPAGGEVEVEALAENGRISVEVRDRGPGIASEHHALIFEKFGRVSGKQAKPGTGLGLFIARSIAEAHGGSLEVRVALGAAQLIGMGVLRYVVRVPALADASVEEIVAVLGPTLQAHLLPDG